MRPVRISARSAIAVTLALTFLAAGVCAEDSPRNTPIVKVIQEWAPSVVNISTERLVFVKTNPYWGNYGGVLDDFYKQFPPTMLGTMKLNGVGSGVVISKDGLILTNAHVIQMASKVYVILRDGTHAEAVLVAVNPQDDLALIKITAPSELKPVKVASDVMIGETVIAIGNPFGLENSVSSGIVSGINRRFYAQAANYTAENLIQTDTPINPGSSGGALFNLAGELVGLNLAVVQNAQSIGFAIPFTKIRKILEDYEQARKEPTVVRIPNQ